MSKFIGLKKVDEWQAGYSHSETSVIVNLDNISYLEVEKDIVSFKSGEKIQLNRNSTKFLLEILLENEYKLEVEAE